MLIDNDCPSVGHIHRLLSVFLPLSIFLSCSYLPSSPILSSVSSPGSCSISVGCRISTLLRSLIDNTSVSPSYSVYPSLSLYVCVIPRPHPFAEPTVSLESRHGGTVSGLFVCVEAACCACRKKHNGYYIICWLSSKPVWGPGSGASGTLMLLFWNHI